MFTWFLTELRFNGRKYRRIWLQLVFCCAFLATAGIVLTLLAGARVTLERSVPAALPGQPQYFTLFGQTKAGAPAGFAMAHFDKIAATPLADQLALYQALPATVQLQGAEHPVRIATVSANFMHLLQIPLLDNQLSNGLLQPNQMVVSAGFKQKYLTENSPLLIAGQPFTVAAVLPTGFCAPDLNEPCPDLWINSQHLHLLLPDTVLTKPKNNTATALLKAEQTKQAFAYLNTSFQLYGAIPGSQSLETVRQQLPRLSIYSSNGQVTYNKRTVSSSSYAQLQQMSLHHGLIKSPEQYLQQQQLLNLVLVAGALLVLFGLLSLALLVSHQYQQSQAEIKLRTLLGQRWQNVLRLISTDVLILLGVLLASGTVLWQPVSVYLTTLPLLGPVVAGFQQQLGMWFFLALLTLLAACQAVFCLALFYLSTRQRVDRPHTPTMVHLSMALSFSLLLILAPGTVILRAELARAQSAPVVGSTDGIYSSQFTGSFLLGQFPDPAIQQQALLGLGIQAELATLLPLRDARADLEVKLANQAGALRPAFSNTVSDGFYQLMQVRLLSGQLPQQSNDVVINATFARDLAIAPDRQQPAVLMLESGEQYNIVGVVSDLHYTDPYQAADPVVYFSAKHHRDHNFFHVFSAAPAQFAQLAQRWQTQAKDYRLESQQQLNLALNQNFNSLIQVLTLVALIMTLVLLLVFYYAIQRLIARLGKEPLLYLALGCPLQQIPYRLMAKTVPPLCGGALLAVLLLSYLGSKTGPLSTTGWVSLSAVGLLLLSAFLLSIGLPLLQQLRRPLNALLGEMHR